MQDTLNNPLTWVASVISNLGASTKFLEFISKPSLLTPEDLSPIRQIIVTTARNELALRNLGKLVLDSKSYLTVSWGTVRELAVERLEHLGYSFKQAQAMVDQYGPKKA